MTAPTLILPTQAGIAHSWIDLAPKGTRVRYFKPTRTIPQNDRMWALLADVAQAQPRGRQHTPETWKALFMHACGHETRFEMGLNSEPFPMGFRSSKLTKEQMGELMDFIEAWGAQNGVRFSDV